MQAYQKYQRVNISTADPLRIVIMLYEGSIKFLNQALRTADTDFTAAGQSIGRALDIVNYLRNSLDHEKGGEIADNLLRLYDYVRDVLNDANIHHDSEKIQEAITLLQTLLDGWRGILVSGVQAPNHNGAPSAEIITHDANDISSSGLSMVG